MCLDHTARASFYPASSLDHYVWLIQSDYLHFTIRSWVCWSTGPADPIISKNQKIVLQNFGQLTFFLSTILCFLKERKRKWHITNLYKQLKPRSIYHYYNKLQIAGGGGGGGAMQNIIFKKIPTLRIKWYYFYFADRLTLFFWLSCP